MKEADVMSKYVSTIAAISADRGLELIQSHDCPVNGQLFEDFIDRLMLLRGDQKIAIFMD